MQDPNPLADLVERRLHLLGINQAEAVRLTGIDKTTMSAIVRGSSRAITTENREKLELLGLPRPLIDYAAAASAGYDVTPPKLTAHEFRRVLAIRGLRRSQVRVIDHLIDSMMLDD